MFKKCVRVYKSCTPLENDDLLVKRCNIPQIKCSLALGFYVSSISIPVLGSILQPSTWTSQISI